MLTEKQRKLLKNRFWRLNNLYKIKDKNGKCVTFKMTPEQLEYFDGMHDRNVILKARQLGFTTEVCIIQLDLAIFHKKECALIAHSLPDAERLFRNKTQFAYQRMTDDIKLANPLVKETTSEYVFSKGGSVTVSTSFRGGTLYSLHVSEFGKICAKYPEKAKEIVTGAFEAVPLGGVITLESTAEGRAGYFYDYCQDAEKALLQGKELSNLDWKFFFFSWWKNPQYAIDPVEPLPQRLVDYFAEMESKHGVVVNERQRAWYYAKEKTLGDDMKREYPTIPAEAFQQSVEGAYYAKQFRWLYTNKRIGQLPDNSHLPVHTFWDIGVGDSTAIWFVREVGEEFHIIDYYENSGGGSTPKLLDDNLKSKQFYRVLDLISEGPIYGPVDQSHLSSFLLNKTPVTSSNGTVNINGVSVAWRPGSEFQSPINGFSAIEATTIINNDVTFDTPLVRAVTDVDVTRVRFNVGVSGLVQQDKKGNQKNTSVILVLETRSSGGPWFIQRTVTITGKISGEYLEAHVIDAPESKPFDIRVRRITPDSTSDLLTNGTIWNSYSEITDDNLNYPFSAVCGAVIDRDQYTDTPSRTYHLRGLIVSVPDNYNPITRTYTGLWTGGFKQAWTNNPAWIFRELAKNTRFGLARSAGYVDVDDGAMYILSQYCDQLVDDGYGGKEPRMTLNAYITEQVSARDILDKIAGMCRGIALWDGMRLTVLIDAPQDPIAVVTNASVVDGKFSYSSAKQSERYNAVVVSWTDPDNGWEQVKEYVSDDDLIARFRYNETTLEAFGCTSRGQAYRAGKWMLETAKRETNRVAFQMARDAIAFTPGDIVEVMDNDYAGTRLGGRILSHNGVQITVDADVSTLAGSGDNMSLMGSNGKFVKHEIVSVAGRIITLKTAPAWVRDGTVFAISTTTLATRLFRILSIEEADNNSVYSISAARHDPNKQAIVDEGAVFEIPSDTLNGYRVPNIENLRIINVDSETVQVTATWETATTTKKLVFELYVYSESGAVVEQYETDQFRYDIYGLDAGNYTLGVRGRNENGMKGAETQVNLIIGAPLAPSGIVWTPGIFSADVVPVMRVTSTTDTTFEFWYAGETQIIDAAQIEDLTQFLGRSSQWTLHGLKADTTYYMYVRTKNAFGVSAFVEASGQASADIPGMIEYIDEAIRDSTAFENLQNGVDSNLEGVLQVALDNNASVDRQFAQYGEVKAEVMTVTTTVANLDGSFAQLADYVQAQIGPDGELVAAVNQKMTAEVKSDGSAKASYTLNMGIVRAGVKYNTGFGMSIEPDGDTYKSTVVFAADKFGIYSGSDPANYQAAFFTSNGQTFINEGFINYASITLAKVGSWYSANYVAGKSGTIMNADGSFELNGSGTGTSKGGMKISNVTQSVRDNNGVLRVQVGKITGVF